MMKNAFYFTFKALFVHKIFKFLSWLFGHAEKRFDWKDMVHFKIYDVTTWKTIAIQYNIIAVQLQYNTILPNISRSKGNMTMKFCQLLEYNMKNIFLEKIIHKMC